MEITNLVQSSTGTQTPVVNTTTDSSNTVASSSTTAPVADKLSITSSNIAIAQTVITQQVDIALEIKNPVSISSHHKHDNHTEELVDKILKRIHHERGSDKHDVSHKDKHEAAVKSVSVKIAQSFESAAIVLSQLGVLDDSVVDEIDQTRASIDDAIEQAASQPSAEADAAPVPASASVETTAMNTVSGSREVSSALQITTRDGDVVTLNFSRSQSVQVGSIDGPGGSLVYASSSSSSLVEFSVQGDLDKKELKAIEKVIKRVSKLAEKLFEGNTGAAMGKLGALKIDTKQLASMSLSMSSSISYQAMSAYAQVSRIPDESAPTTPEAAQTPVVQSPVQVETVVPVASSAPVEPTAVQVVNEVADVVNETVAAEVFENPFDQIRDLFAQIANIFASAQSYVSSDHKDFIGALFNDITDELEEEHHHHHHDDSGEDSAEITMAA